MSKYKYIFKRLRNVGVSHEDALTVHGLFEKYVRQNGYTGAVIRFKALGDQILSYLYGGPKVPWVKTLQRFPREIICLKKYSEETLIRISKIARAITFTKVTAQQVTKVLNGVQLPFSGVDFHDTLSSVLKRGVEYHRLSAVRPQFGKVPILGRQFRRVTSLSGKTPVQSSPPLLESAALYQVKSPLTELSWSLEPFLPALIGNKDLSDIDFSEVRVDLDCIGEIHAAQEGGGKLRMFAAPYQYYQCLLSPIHDWIDDFRRVLPTDCTYDQPSGALWAQKKLVTGCRVHSVDLSTATCRFPLDIQLWLLSVLGLSQEAIDALAFACRGKWKVSSHLVESGFPPFLSWEVGQPLGIRPSMSMFSLTHNLLLSGLCSTLDIDPSDSFRVLGDDVVIANDDLHDRYRIIIEMMGVPISENKSHSSSVFAEFAGFTISRNCLVRPGKWRKADYYNHVSIAEDLGTPLFEEVPDEILATEKLWLFRLGSYNPSSIEEYSRLLRANTLLNKYSLEYKPLIGGKTWFSGFKDEVKSQLGEVDFSPYSNSVPTVFTVLESLRTIPGLGDGLVRSCRMGLTTFNYDYERLWYIYGLSLSYIYNSVVDGVLTNQSALPLLKKVESAISAYYWRPPVLDRHNDATITKLLSKALAL